MVSISKQTWSVIVLGAVSGFLSYFGFLVFLQFAIAAQSMWALLTGIPGVIFGTAVIMLASIRRCRAQHEVAWVCASWLSFQSAFWFLYVISQTEPGLSLLQHSLLFGSVGFVGGVVLLIACRMLIGNSTMTAIMYFLCCAFVIPAVILPITGGIQNTDLFSLPPMHYFLYVMILWQTVALLFIDTLARRHAPQDVVGVRTT